jgi:hypothetical protein
MHHHTFTHHGQMTIAVVLAPCAAKRSKFQRTSADNFRQLGTSLDCWNLADSIARRCAATLAVLMPRNGATSTAPILGGRGESPQK